ncbi:MAG: EAL domain-containing protein [Oscillospiraceae bacterium]
MILEDNFDNMGIYYQAQFDLVTNNVVGIKTFNKNNVKATPNDVDFQDSTKKAEYIAKLDLSALEKAGELQKNIFKKSKKILPVFVAISVCTIINPYNIYEITSLIKSFNLPENSINLLLVNAESIDNVNEVSKSLKHFMRHNIKMYLGDIATMAVFVELLNEIKPSGIVISKTLFGDVTLDSRKYCILKEIILICTKFNIDTICDGVKNAMEAKILKDLGYKKSIGDFYMPPMTYNLFERNYITFLW